MKSFTQFLRIIFLSFILIWAIGFVCLREFTGKTEARGIWLTRWEYTTTLETVDPNLQQAKIIEVMDMAAKEKFNFILFQVRGQCDAFYRSHCEPWAKELTGVLGQDPSWDPLEFAIEQAHQRGLELHVWVNTFTCWKGEEPTEACEPQHLYHVHPEWLCADSSGIPMQLNPHYVSLSPGIPEVREYVHNIMMDIVKNYDIDGIHFDYIRYPDYANRFGYSHDSISVMHFNSPKSNPDQLSWEDWQREQINKFVRKFYDEATILKPMLKISAAVIGKYDWSEWNGFDAMFQDARKWMEEGKMDFIVPMIYWRRGNSEAPFGKIAQEWIEKYRYNRYIFPGMAVYKINNAKWPPNEIEGQVNMIRRLNGKGMVFFSYSGLMQLSKQFTYKGFKYLANLPPMRWKDSVPPNPPSSLRVEESTPEQIVLIWDPPQKALDGDGAAYYNIYRSTRQAIDTNSARNLLAITTHNEPIFTDSQIEPETTYFYAVSALDDGDNESLPSDTISIKVSSLAKISSKKGVVTD